MAQPLSTGAELLRNAGTLDELATRTGVARSTIGSLRSGKLRAPSDAVALKLEAVLGIPRGAWYQRQAEEGYHEPGPSAVPPAEPDESDASPRGHLAIVRAFRQKLQREGAAPRDVTAALECERRAVELVRKATEEDAEEIINEILAALEGYPEARAAVAAVLESRE